MKDIIINGKIYRDISKLNFKNNLGEIVTFIEESELTPSIIFDRVLANNSWTQIAAASEIIKANNYTSAQVKEIFG